MKYFLDTEFIEHATGIELLSIGIVCEDGRTFYAENTTVDTRLADDWVKENVLSKLSNYSVTEDNILTNVTQKELIKGDYIYIREELLKFIKDDNPIFYAYYADYDWVVFCKIFGRMIDLPKHFPMYCRDLKQTLDEKIDSFLQEKSVTCITINRKLDETLIFNTIEEFEIDTFSTALEKIKNCSKYPKQNNEHNALDDAKWNFELYKFLKIL